ncbi:MAG: polysaccharide biosynthesis C-terminal domain-containing protein [Bacteroidota bacterium]
MGIVVKQGIFNAVNLVTGFIIGAVNTIVLVPFVFDTPEKLENWGWVSLIVNWGTIFSQFLNFGAIAIVIRYNPKFREQGKEGKSLFFAWLFPLVGTLLLGLFLLFGSEWFFGSISKNPVPGLVLFSFLMFIITFSFNFHRSMNGIAISRYKTVMIAFINEVFIRLLAISTLFLYYFEVISLEGFFIAYSLTFVIQLIALFLFLGGFSLFKIDWPERSEFNECANYGIYSFFDSGATILVSKIDIAMIGAMIGTIFIPYYSLAFFMATVVTVPYRSLLNISLSVMADYYHNGEWGKISELYKKSSLNMLLSGGIIFILIWCSVDDVLATQPEEFKVAKYCFLFLGLAKLFDLFTSVNGIILSITKYYRLNLVFTLIMLVFVVITNYFLIPVWDITGAALATAVCVFVFNIMKSIFLFSKFGIHPIHKNTFMALACLALPLAAGIFIPSFTENHLLNAVIRSAIISGLFIPLVYFTRVSEEMNTIFGKVLVMVGVKK